MFPASGILIYFYSLTKWQVVHLPVPLQRITKVLSSSFRDETIAAGINSCSFPYPKSNESEIPFIL